MPDDRLSQAIALAKAGKKDDARPLLLQILKENHRDESAWLLLAQCLPDDAQRISALEQCLRFVPNSQKARQGLEVLRARQNKTQDGDRLPENIPATASTASSKHHSSGTPSSTPPFTVSAETYAQLTASPDTPGEPAPKENSRADLPADQKKPSLSLMDIGLIGVIGLAIIGICAFLGWSMILSPRLFPVATPTLFTATIKPSATPLPTGTPYFAPTRRPSITPTPGPTIDPNNPAILFQDIACTIKVVSVTGGDPIQLTVDQPAVCNNPQISPDGQKILYTEADVDNPNRSTLYVANVDGTSAQVVLDKKEYLYDAHWAPDNSWISYNTFIGSNESGQVLGINLVNEDGSGNVQLTDVDSGSIEPATGDDVVWSPDGQWLAFVGGGIPQAVRSDGTELVKLSSENAPGASLVWSPDSSRVAYYNPDENNIGIVIAGLDGSQNLVQNPSLTVPLQGSGLAWTPDGNQIVALDITQKSLVLVSADGTQVNPLVSVNGWVNHMAWSADGTQLAFVESADAGSTYGQLRVVNADGSGLSTLATTVKDVPFIWKMPNTGSLPAPLAINPPTPSTSTLTPAPTP